MKKIRFLVFVLMVCFCFILSACAPTGNTDAEKNGQNGNTSDTGTYFTVTFDSQGGSAVESVRVREGNPVSSPTSPTRENYDFGGWYLSADADAARWDFATDRVNKDITLYAHWTAKEEQPAPSDTLKFERNDAGTGYIVTGDGGQSTTIVIPETYENLPVVGIGESAFAYSKHTATVLSIIVPDSVTTIEKNAFYSRQDLTEVKIGEHSRLTAIGNNAFSGCTALTAISLPETLAEIGNAAFNNCGGLNTITVANANTHYSGEGNNLIDLATGTLIRGSNSSVIPSSVTAIGEAAFRRATLTTLTIPASVTSIAKYAFSDSSVSLIIYGGTMAAWSDAVKGANGKEVSWKSSKQEITVRCSDTQGKPETNSKVLVAYFSCTGNTEKIAGYIAEVTGGHIYEISPAQPYTEEDLNYSSSCRANDEQNNPAARPAISGSVDNMADYDVIYLGYPIWWSKAPKIIYTFLESYEFSGKTIVPFCTSGSSSITGSLPDIKAIASDATWLGGSRFSSSTTQSQIKTWVDGLEL